MIRLEARQAATEAAPLAAGPLRIAAALFVEMEGKTFVLCEQQDLAAALEKEQDLTPLLRQRAQFERAGYRLVFHSATQYQEARTLYEYWAVKTTSG